MSNDLRKAAEMMASRLELFKKTATAARERGDVVELDPRELWEAADQAALDAYRAASNFARGVQALPFPDAATSFRQEVSPC